MGTPRAIVLLIDSHPNNVSLVGLAVHAYCDHFYGGTFSSEVELGIVEALNNVIEHGYQGQNDKPIQVRLELHREALICQIRDYGNCWFLGDQPIEAMEWSKDSTALESLPEGGFGLFLIHQVMDHVELQQENPGSLLTLKKYSQPAEEVKDEA